MATSKEIHLTMEKIKPGLTKYVEIMDQLKKVNVSTDAEFQRQYNGFYRMRQRNTEFYEIYYAYMEANKNKTLAFEDVLIYLFEKTGRLEASFSSKLIATINPGLPIWDVFVLKNLGLEAPKQYSKTRIKDTVQLYDRIVKWYEEHLSSEDGKSIIEIFDENFPEVHISDVKKIDFVLWQTREVATISREQIRSLIQEMIDKAGGRACMPLQRGDKSFFAEYNSNGVFVSNLANQSQLPWEVFYEVVELLEKSGGKAIKGDAMSGKLGDTRLPLDSVEGWVANKVYHKEIGETVFRRITPISGILNEAGICINGRGELKLNL